MALLICYLNRGENINWARKAIYLDQRFYELIFKFYKETERHSVLREIVSIGYDKELVLEGTRLTEVMSELEYLMDVRSVAHPQIETLLRVLRTAISRECNLAIAGDMCPDLSKE